MHRMALWLAFHVFLCIPNTRCAFTSLQCGVLARNTIVRIITQIYLTFRISLLLCSPYLHLLSSTATYVHLLVPELLFTVHGLLVNQHLATPDFHLLYSLRPYSPRLVL